MENETLIDDCFYVKETPWNTWNSYHADGDKPILTSLTKEICIESTRFYLKKLQDNRL